LSFVATVASFSQFASSDLLAEEQQNNVDEMLPNGNANIRQ
jgi:hypothetical protein